LNLIVTQFAQSDSGSSGLGAFQLNIKDFIIQLVTFVLVFLVLRKWVIPKLSEIMEIRRKTLEKSLEDAKAATEALAKAEAHAEEILNKARVQADEALAQAKDAGSEIVAKAETAAGERAELIVREAEERLGYERAQMVTELKKELAGLVAVATERVLNQKINEREDRVLIERSLKDIG